jgi:arabinofuranan 3-O-arabinosyltransferase
VRKPVAGGVAEPALGAVWRLRYATVCSALTALALLQRPGTIVADTKIDLVINPLGFLQRGLHLWDPTGSFGQAQNQADGYLWPMGPFFLAGDALGIPAWILQRLWWALLLCVAFTGVVAFASRLRIGTPTSRLIAGIAFALTPRVLSELGASSVEAWPMAVAPWVLVPLIGIAGGARLRRSIGLSAMALACAGGVNATAAFAVVPLAILWLAMLRPVRRRVVALVAWAAAAFCATGWWVLPLLIFGPYSTPFLDYTERAEATTSVTDSVTVLRGASQWVAYLGSSYGPIWPAGSRLALDTLAIVATVAVAALGVMGLSRRSMPHRHFLVTGVVLGVALVGFGHVSELPGTLAAFQREFLDGFGAPLRNMHKFDVVLRLPLMLGLAHLVGVMDRVAAARPALQGSQRRPVHGPAALVFLVSIAAVLGVVASALSAGLAPRAGFASVPQYWRDAATWLDEHTDRNRVLVIPAAPFAKYTWGDTGDEITQPLLTVPWGVRNIIPMAPPTTIRLLDAVEAALATGQGSSGLSAVLARSGVQYVLLRSDVDYGRATAARPMVVRQALSRSPGLTSVAAFGPAVGGSSPANDYGLGSAPHALEVFRVGDAVAPVVVYDQSDVATVVGGPESLLDVASAGLLTQAPTVLAGDLGGRKLAGPVLLTDSLRRKDVSFGQSRDNTSATLTTDEMPLARDYAAAGGRTTVQYHGISAIGASSSWSQAGLLTGSRPEHQPFAALDDDPATSWRPAPGLTQGQWLEVTLESPTAIPRIDLQFDLAAGAVPAKVTVNAGIESASVTGIGSSMVVTLPGLHATRTVRITVESALAIRPGGIDVGIAELTIPGVRASRTLIVPRSPAQGSPASVVLSAAPATAACFFAGDDARCAPSAARASEDAGVLDRTVTLPTTGVYTPTIWAQPRPGWQLNAVLDREISRTNPLGIAPSITASSVNVADPAGRPGVLLDGDAGTVWSPSLVDPNPLLHITWLGSQTITGLKLTLAHGVPATLPAGIQVVGDDGVQGGLLRPDGVVMFDRPMKTDDISILFTPAPRQFTFEPYLNDLQPLPLGIGEITALPALPARRLDLDVAVTLSCGSGPTVDIGGQQFQTKLTGTRRDLFELRQMQADVCGAVGEFPIAMSAGEKRLVATRSVIAAATRLVLAPVGRDQTAAGRPSQVRVDLWGSNERRVHIGAAGVPRLLVVRENTNPGWQASLGGRPLESITIDGWQQGWLLPAGAAGDVVLRYLPDSAYRTGLVVGAVLLVALVVLTALPVRRRGTHEPRSRAPRATTGGRFALWLVGGSALILAGGALGAVVVTLAVLIKVAAGPRPHRRWSRWLEAWLPAAFLGTGAWLAVTGVDSHYAVAPQAAGLLTVTVLWFATAFAPARPAGAPGPQGPLQRVVAQRGKDKTTRDGGTEDSRHSTGEGGPVLHPEVLLKNQRVP